MAQRESRLRVHKEGGVVHVSFVDRNILDEANIQQIGEEIGLLIDAEPNPKLEVNFSNVDHLSSAALGTLISVHNRLKTRKGQLRLAAIDPQIYEVFVITRLNKLFDIHETPEKAVASFA